MAFQSAGEKVKIKLADGQVRKLFFSFLTLEKIREELGISFNDSSTYGKLNEKTLPDVMAMGLIPLEGEEPFTRLSAAALMDGEQTNEYFASCVQAANGSNIMAIMVEAKNVKGSRPKTEQESETKPTQPLLN